MPVALAIDIGTSSVRASLWDDEGRAVGSVVQRSTSGARIGDGPAEFDADVLLGLIEETLDELLVAAGADACRIVAVGTSCFWHSLVGVTASGTPATAVSTWADTSAHATAARLRTVVDEAAYHRRTGAMLHSSYPIARLAHRIDTTHSSSEPVATWMSFADYARLRLLGKSATGASMASGSGLFNLHSNDWDAEALDLAGVTREQMPDFSEQPASGLVEFLAARWPAIARVPWFPAIGDGACATIGSGCVGPDRIALTLGTSGAVRIVVAGPDVEVHDGLFAYRVDRTRWVVGGALSEGGGFVAWLCSMFGIAIDADLDEQLAAMKPDEHGLTILPFASGERSPGWRDDARCTISGMSAETRPVAIVRAALESVAFRFQLIAERLRDLAPEAREIVGSGEALRASPAWCRIVADVLEQRLVVPDCAETSSRGAALLALEATGDLSSLADVPALESTAFEPDASVQDRYRAAARRQQKLDDAIIS